MSMKDRTKASLSTSVTRPAVAQVGVGDELASSSVRGDKEREKERLENNKWGRLVL
jgi:hypothetical protein